MRVIVNSAKGLPLKTLDGLDTRPTTDRIKETPFNMLRPDLSDCTLLNLFSGSGAIGIEALSRGAGLAMMTESNPRTLERTRENLVRTRLGGRTMVMGCGVITGLKRLEGKNYRFDIVFMDPPYHREHKRLVLNYLSRFPTVTEDTLIVIKASRETDLGQLEEFGWHMIKGKEYRANEHVSVGRGKQIRATVYPGSSDSAILGYYDIIKRTARIMDKLAIGVLNNKAKYPLFSAQERVNMLKEVTASLPNMEIQSFENLLIDFVRGGHVDIAVRGLWAITDFEYELQMTRTNRVTAPEIDTIFLTTNLEYSYLSSSIVKEIAEYEGGINEFLHPVIAVRIRGELEEGRRLI